MVSEQRKPFPRDTWPPSQPDLDLTARGPADPFPGPQVSIGPLAHFYLIRGDGRTNTCGAARRPRDSNNCQM